MTKRQAMALTGYMLFKVRASGMNWKDVWELVERLCMEIDGKNMTELADALILNGCNGGYEEEGEE